MLNTYQKESAMQRKFMRSLIVLTLVLLSQLANAFVDPPTLSPTNPTEGQTVSVNIRVGQCDALPATVPGYPQITQTGNALRILLYSLNQYDPEFCIYPTLMTTTAAGTYPAGSYTLQVDRTYSSRNGPVVETLGTLPFIVTAGPQPASLPAISLGGLVALMAIILLIAVMVLRHRQPDRNTSNS